MISEVIVSNKTEIIFMNRIKLENETLLEEERDLMGSLSEFACPIPEKQINYLESDFFYELK